VRMGDIQPLLRNVNAHNCLAHETPVRQAQNLGQHAGLHAGANALTTVRVFDRDAGSLKILSVVADLSTIEGLPASHPTDAADIMQSTSLPVTTQPRPTRLVDGRAKPCHDGIESE